jgi:ATP-binding cassette subfamily B multidrug efflux pump
MEPIQSSKSKVQISVGKRLFNYALMYKYRITLAIFLLCLAVGAELAGPFIAKTIIDKHIIGIQKPWYEMGVEQVPNEVPYVLFSDSAYVRSDWIEQNQKQTEWKEVRIIQDGISLYLVRSEGEQFMLTAADITSFYQHDVVPIMKLIGIFLILLVIASTLHFIQSYTLQKTALRIIQKMRMDVMRHIQRIPVSYFDNTPIGQVVSRIANDTEAIRDLFMSFMATFVVSGVTLMGIFVALFILDVRLALICLTLIPLFVLIMVVHLKFAKKYISIMRARLADMNAMLNETIHVMPIIQAFRKEKETVKEFNKLNEERFVNQIKQFKLFSLSSRNITSLIGSLFIALVIWYFGGQSLHTAISFGVFFAFIEYLGRFFQPIIGIFDQLTNAQRAFVAADKVFQILDLEGNNVEKLDHFSKTEGRVSFNKVSFAYKEEDYVLKDISFDVNKGETIALVGHTGSGKSSIMNLLLGFYEPTKGSITIDDRDISLMSKQELRKNMGVVLQDPFLFAGDIKFNVSMYNDQIDIEQVKHALKSVGAQSFVEQLPLKYDEPVIERGSTLSSGQRQLISFARALAFNPSILILDEATASIDSETEGLIQQALKVLSKGRTTFVIAHRLSTIRDADLILVLHRGEIVERGSHEELMKQQGRYYRMYQLQKGEIKTLEKLPEIDIAN